MRKEVLYALGQPEDLPTDQMLRLMEQADTNIQISGLLASMNRFGQSYFQAVERLNPDGRTQRLEQIGENSFAPYRKLLADGLFQTGKFQTTEK